MTSSDDSTSSHTGPQVSLCLPIHRTLISTVWASCEWSWTSPVLDSPKFTVLAVQYFVKMLHAHKNRKQLLQDFRNKVKLYSMTQCWMSPLPTNTLPTNTQSFRRELLVPKSFQTSNKKQSEGSSSISPCFSHVRGKSDSRSSFHRDLLRHSDLTADSRAPRDLHRLCFRKFTELKRNSTSLKQ